MKHFFADRSPPNEPIVPKRAMPAARAAWLAAIMTCFAAGVVEAQEATPAPDDWRGAADSAAWSEIAGDAISAAGAAFSEGSPQDISAFCPGYANLDAAARKAFWVSFLADIAWVESGDDVDRVRWHAYDAAARRPTFRRGLFQIAIESANDTKYACAITDVKELESAEPNIRCAVTILGSSLQRDGAIARHDGSHIAGAARYWRALRDEPSRREIARETAALPQCRAHAT